VNGIKLFLAGGEELPDRPRPTALPKTMQVISLFSITGSPVFSPVFSPV